MNVIKQLGNSHPQLALASYDSLKDEFTKGSTYVRNKYTLLGIRLRDKAELPHTSDSCIRRLVPYFEKKRNHQRNAGSVLLRRKRLP